MATLIMMIGKMPIPEVQVKFQHAIYVNPPIINKIKGYYGDKTI